MRALTKSLGLLSDETRLRILNVLVGGESCVCEVMKALGITQSTASRGLTALHDAGFLKLRKEGLWSLYSIDTEGMQPYQARLVEIIIDELKNNDTASKDRENLKQAQRTGPRATSAAMR